MIRRRHRDGLGQALLLALAVLCLSCEPAAPPPVLEVEYGRCHSVYLPGPVCALWRSRRLSLWVKASPGAEVEVRAGGQLLKVEPQDLRGGWQYRLTLLPDQVSAVEVSLRLPDGARGPSWSLALADTEEPAWQAEIRVLDGSGKRKESWQRLIELRKTAPRKEQGLILQYLALLARENVNNAEAEAYVRQGILADRDTNCWSCVDAKTAWLAGLYLDQGRFGDARRTLTALRLPPMAPAESKYLARYYNGVLASRVGDYRSALEQLREAASLAEKGGRPDFRWKAEQELATLLQNLGRSQEASELFVRLQKDPHPDSPCELGDLLTNRAWSLLLKREGGEEAEDPTPLLKEAQAIYDGNSACNSRRLNVRLNLAFAHQQANRWHEARQSLDQARSLAFRTRLSERLWWHDLEGRSATAEGHPLRALRLYEELDEMGGRAFSLEVRFRAALGRARAQLALGRRAEALTALAEADRLIDEQAWHVPAHEGRDTLVAQRAAATRLYLSLLLEEGDLRGAFALVRRARSRLLRQLTVRDRLTQLKPQEQDRWDRALANYQALRNAIDREATQEWQLPGNQRTRARESRELELAQAREDLDHALAGLGIPGSESTLAPPRPGEVILAYHPLPEGWVGFAVDERGIEVSRFELPEDLEPAALAVLLLEPFHSTLERAERVRVLPYGRLRSIDFHLLPFNGKPLLDRHLVVYALDLPARPQTGPPHRSVALLVADPEGDLPAARQEAREVAKAVQSWEPDWTLERLDGTAARAEAVRTAPPQDALFHYAGHGTFAGFAGWDSVLTLADGTRLTLGDLLALDHAPAWVVLSSCDAGRTSEQTPSEGIGLAHAFLLAGSQAVVAATRKVPDRTSRDLVMELYRGWRPGVDLSRQFQRAQRVCLQRHPAADCASFRLLEP